MKIIDEENRYFQALNYAIVCHDGQHRIGGLPYVTHPIAVSKMLRDKGYGIDYQIAGLFHDLLEDTEASEDDILEIGGEEGLKAVKVLTKNIGDDDPVLMKAYHEQLMKNPIAFKVKSCDRLHNIRCAAAADDAFKLQYIKESVIWYLDFDEEIPKALSSLLSTLTIPFDDKELLEKLELSL